MAEQIILNKRVYSKTQYPDVIDVSFKQLVPTNTTNTPQPNLNLPSINEFFAYYDSLFYTIPKEGEINSHQYLVNRSQEYIGEQTTSTEVQALLREITELRAENLQLLQQISNLNTTNV